ncbi:MAG TPA: CopG family transcriptional regulator [Thermoanaerobaculia bacterium]|nr:CopG family transcriptional regulator [Thermoanaerobaculia bacterium]
MRKTTVYLPDDLKRRLEAAAREQGRAEADLIRDAIANAVGSAAPLPRVPLVAAGLGNSRVAANADDFLDGFGQ